MTSIRFAQAVLLVCAAPWIASAVLPGGSHQFVKVGNYDAHPTRILARLKSDAAAASLDATLDSLGMKVRREYKLVPGLVVLDSVDPRIAPSARARVEQLTARIQTLRDSGLFQYVEPDFIASANLQPDDTAFQDGTLWGLKNDGSNGGVVGADVGAEGAWDITTGSSNVIVAVIDTGVWYTHADLAANMWVNPDEIPDNGEDDDGDGWVDNIHGIDAVNNDGDPKDDAGHGTHVSGTIGAVANNGHPHVGVAWEVTIMALKAFDAQGFGDTEAEITCIEFSVQEGARISNNSWGGFAYSQALNDAIGAARDAGQLFVAAAGNESNDNDNPDRRSYPASFEWDNIVSVAALDRADKLAWFSNYGQTSVDIGAPGVEIFSCWMGNDTAYKTIQGTSMASPHIAGVAALILAEYPDSAFPEIIERMYQTAVPVPDLQGVTVTGGRVDAESALLLSPDGFLELTVSPASGDTIVSPSTNDIVVRVSDLFGVTNATVTASVTNNGDFYTDLTFLDDGNAPDTTAGDANYTATLVVPEDSTNLVMLVAASAPEKTNAVSLVQYVVITLPTNDDFAKAKKIPSPGGTVVSSTELATMQVGEPLHAGVATVDHSLWYNWSPTTSGQALVDPAGSAFDTVVAVYRGNNLLSLVPIASVDDVGDNQQGYLFFNATAGTTYRIAVAGANTDQAGTMRLRAVVGGQPDAVPPVYLIYSPPSGSILTSNNIVLEGIAFDPPPNASGIRDVQVVLNDGLGQVAFGTTNWSIPLVLREGTNSVKVRATDFSGNTSQPAGSPYLLTYLPPRTDNDLFVDAIALEGTSGSDTNNNSTASKEFGEPDHAGNEGGKSLWWTYVPPEDGFLTLSTTNSPGDPEDAENSGPKFDTLLGLYMGDYVSELTTIASNDDVVTDKENRSQLTQAVLGGVTYHIAVDGYLGAAGDIVLDYVFTPSPVYYVDVSNTTGGYVTPGSDTYPSNTLVTLTAVVTNETEISFNGWTGDIESLDNPLVFNVRSNTTVMANFQPIQFADDFETGGFNTDQLDWDVAGGEGNIPWIVQSNDAGGGIYAAQSGPAGDNQTSSLALTAYTGGGFGHFLWKVSSEEGWDELRFYVDGQRVGGPISGEVDWLQFSFLVDEGTHDFLWEYKKDFAGSAGLDAAFIDSLFLPTIPSSFELTDPGLGEFTILYSGPPNSSFVVEGTTDFTDWQAISTNRATNDVIRYVDPTASSNDLRFYRTVAP